MTVLLFFCKILFVYRCLGLELFYLFQFTLMQQQQEVQMEQQEQQQQQEKNPEQIREELHDQMMKVIRLDQNAKKVKELLDCGVRPNSFINAACCVGDDLRNVEVVRVLLEAKATVNHRDQHGFTPLHYAADDHFSKCAISTPMSVNQRAGSAIWRPCILHAGERIPAGELDDNDSDDDDDDDDKARAAAWQRDLYTDDDFARMLRWWGFLWKSTAFVLKVASACVLLGYARKQTKQLAQLEARLTLLENHLRSVERYNVW